MIAKEKYWFQYNFRHTSISFIFLREFVCWFAIVILFLYINLQYLDLFRQTNFTNFSGKKLDNEIQSKIDEYKSINLIGITFSIVLMSSPMFKVLYNIFSTSYIPSDRWSKIEFLSAFINMITFIFLNNLTVEEIK